MARSPRRSRLASASLAVATVLALAACGGDDDDDTSGTTESTEATDDTTEATGAPGTSDPTDTTGSSDTSDTSDTAGTGDTTDTGTTPGAGTGGGEVAPQEDYIEATAQQIGYGDEEMSQCLAEAVVSDEVYAAIEEAGRTVDQFQSEGPVDLGLDEEQVLTVAAEMSECGELIPQVLTDDDERACAEASVDNEQMAQILALSTFGMDLTDELEDASGDVETCLRELSTATTS